MSRGTNYFETCYKENIDGERVTLLAYHLGNLTGCCQLLKNSAYPFFYENGIPEINDLIVFSEYRRNGIAGELIDALEKEAAKTIDIIGIGVGLYQDYGNAQRLYWKKGYVPDGNGIYYKNHKVQPGSSVFVDDDLLLFLTKKLT